ncbi:MAG: alpha-glucan family phosphorylase [Trueperaceae bacterium]|nr:alpha-glucan family phosphorylase [Trueperaceae bacterium]
MNILGRLTVLPHLPTPLGRLDELARNLYWTWDSSARRVFRELDREAWEASGNNPVVMLRDIDQARLDARGRDPEYLALYASTMASFDAYLGNGAWRDPNGVAGAGSDHVYAYFCAEYGWHEGVALYSGGLGVLAGDHTKAASDLALPLVAVGLWYPEGYFHQRVAADGRQEAVYERKNPTDLPLVAATDDEGKPLSVVVQIFGRDVRVRAWRAQVGRIPVYLLDVDVAENHPDDRALLKRLYGGDARTRVSQEIVLGVGGVRMLRALGVAPTSWHMNEGHSAFMALERCREHVVAGLAFEQARELVTAGTVFTVHTPVAAGNDAFSFELVAQAFGGYWGDLGLRQQAFLELGRADHGWGPVFSMPALALRFTSARNGVARLHGETSRRIWNDLWPDVPEDEVPIGHVTNGVHLRTWIAPEIQDLVSRTLPPEWMKRVDDVEMWRAFEEVDPADLWSTRRALKEQSVRFLRRRVLRQLDRQEASERVLRETLSLFDASALTIGFARRFATYKRATLIFRDLDRLAALLGDAARPVQLVFSGKAHPADEGGQGLIAAIHNLSKEVRFAGRVLFVEDYDMAIGRALTRGVDVWLNTPRRPLEASGTSGQKAAMNGILNLSILDGWWPEGFDGRNGWAIGGERTFEDEEKADAADAEALYALLEREVVPRYYERDASGVPVAWMRRSAAAIASVTPRFNAQRMVRDYATAYYAPASTRALELALDPAAIAALARWRERVATGWSDVEIEATPLADEVRRVGEEVVVEATLRPGELGDTDLIVEVVHSADHDELRRNVERVPMELVARDEDGAQRYRARFTPPGSGRLAYGVRVMADHRLLTSPFDSHAIRWA